MRLARERTDESVYVLNMGQPVKIVDLAERMIRLAGLEPGRDLDIVFTGIRPGERLHEILFAREEPTVEIGIAGIVAAKPVCPSVESMRTWLGTLAPGPRARGACGDLSAYCAMQCRIFAAKPPDLSPALPRAKVDQQPTDQRRSAQQERERQ